MTTLKLTDAIIRAGASDKSFARGQELYRNGAISDTAIQGNVLTGHCEGMQAPFYKVRAEPDAGGVRAASCNCDYDFGGYCKHIVALLLTFAHGPEQFVVREDVAKRLAELDREQLLALLTELLDEVPDLSDWLEAAIPATVASRPHKTATAKAAKPKRKKQVDTEVYRRRVRDIIRASGSFWNSGGVADQLHDVEKTALEFLDAGDAETALRILLTMLEECRDCFEYVDDSDVYLGEYLNGLGSTLAEVILSLNLDDEQREELLSDLEKIDSNLSGYGVDGLEVAVAAAKTGWGEEPREAQGRSVEEDDDEEKMKRMMKRASRRAVINRGSLNLSRRR
ncbi:MAG: SWIM zinc finger family protein [Blastocatellia bacterium]